ncbi:MAG TPA: hypothetical protein DCK93_19895 [Blastocatellia bacterium]|nr:hypothetical protein [Blastocatellia bacterium]
MKRKTFHWFTLQRFDSATATLLQRRDRVVDLARPRFLGAFLALRKAFQAVKKILNFFLGSGCQIR